MFEEQIFEYPSEPTAPDEDFSLDSALSPTAPSLSETPLNSNDFNFDPILEEIKKIENEEVKHLLSVINFLP